MSGARQQSDGPAREGGHKRRLWTVEIRKLTSQQHSQYLHNKQPHQWKSLHLASKLRFSQSHAGVQGARGQKQESTQGRLLL